MCQTTLSAGYRVSLIVADGLGNEYRDGIMIFDLGKPKSRIDRILRFPVLAARLVIRLSAKVVHCHDPELLLVRARIARSGRLFVFDAHEHIPNQILSKAYLPDRLRQFASFAFKSSELLLCRHLPLVVGATPTIRDRYISMGIPSLAVRNFPLCQAIPSLATVSAKKPCVCYVGAISATRGIQEIVEALPLCRSEAGLLLGGVFSHKPTECAVRELPGWTRVNALGFLSRNQIHEVYCRAVAGLVTLHPTPSYLDSIPVKMFEYIAAGLPIIASDFPYWRSLLGEYDCALWVDPQNPREIAEAIDYCIQNPKEAQRMGANGRMAVIDRLNWLHQGSCLIRVYALLLNRSVHPRQRSVFSSTTT